MYKRILFKLITFLQLMSLTTTAQTTVEYYVDGSKSVYGDGTVSSPYSRIAYAVFNARDTTKEVIVYIKAGVYVIDGPENNYNFNLVYLDASKSATGKYFTFKPYPGDEGKVIIDGTNLKTSTFFPSMFIINGGKYIRIQNIVFRNLKNTDGQVLNLLDAQNIEITNCRFDSLQWTSNAVEMGYPKVVDSFHFIYPVLANNCSNVTLSNDTVSNSALGWGEFVQRNGVNTGITVNNTIYLANKGIASDYYVALSGNDTTGTGSVAKPWRTGKKAVEQAGRNYFSSDPSTFINAPVNIYYRAGTYKPFPGGLYIPEQRGQNGQWLTIRNYPGENVVLDGSLITERFSALIAVAGAKNVRIEGLKLTKVTNDTINPDVRFGIQVVGKASNIIIKKNEIYNMAWTRNPALRLSPTPSNNLNPLVILGTTDTAIRNVIIDSNTVYNNLTGYAEAISVNGNVDSFAVTNNLVFDNANIGIVAAGNYGWVVTNFTVSPENNYSRNGFIRGNTSYRNISPIAVSAGIYLDGSRNVLVENNLCYHNGTGISVGHEQPNGISGYHTVRSNVVKDNLSAGMFIGSPIGSSWVENCVIKDNTIKDNYMIDSFLSARVNPSPETFYPITQPSQRYAEVTFKRVRNTIFEQNTIESLSNLVLAFFNTQQQLNLRYNTYFVISEDACQATFVQDKNNDNGIALPQDSIYIGFRRYAHGSGYDQTSSSEGETYNGTPNCTPPSGSNAEPVHQNRERTASGNFTFSIYPNPVANDLNIQFYTQKAGNINVSISDLSGRVILQNQQTAGQGNQLLKLSDIRRKGIVPGVYILRVITPDENKVQKIIVH